MTEVADNTLVDGRYRILQRIGSGGMADVYCAEDTHLGREVALKVLHRRFAQDQEFVERFRREAKSAAGLSHPNVVGVFDRGEHDGTYYIAMEHLRGRTLKEVVGAEAPLGQERAIDLGEQILHAAGFAHRHGVIHRDFKPHNVIVDGDGRAKVTDFGIARAGASEMTETGSIMGTAQYLSPEQAQGHAVTAASDLYSIGVMLYEMLAGRLPFEGDSAVSLALKHLSEPPVPISQLRPDVHPALEAVVMAALAKDPAARWQSAEDFAQGLEAARGQIKAGSDDGEDPAALVPLPAPVPAAAAGTPGWPAETGATASPDALAPGAVPAGAAAPAGPAAPPVPTPAGPGDAGNGAVAPPAEPQRRRRRRWPWFTIGLLILAAGGALLLITTGAFEPEKREVPRAEGRQLLRARALLERAGFEVSETRVRSGLPFDQVIDQDPDPREEAEVGSTVTLEVSDGPGEVLVPSVAKLPQKQAIDEIEDAGLRVNLERENSDVVRAGFAIRTVPRAGEEVVRGTRITLFVSEGPEHVAVPGVIGLSSDSAEATLRADGLGVAVLEQESEEPEGTVIEQSPGGGAEVEIGTVVTITVSTGIETVDVPNVVGLRPGAAEGQIGAAGLSAARTERPVTDPAQDGVVIDQRPGAGVELEPGSEVLIVVGVLVTAPPEEQEEVEPAEPAPPAEPETP